MLSSILDGISAIVNLITSIGQFLVYFVKGALSLLASALRLPELISMFMQVLPAEMTTAVLTVVGMCVIIFIVDLAKP